MNEADLVIAEAGGVVFEALRARLAELREEHQAYVEAREEITSSDDWSGLKPLLEKGESPSREIRSVHDALNA